MWGSTVKPYTRKSGLVGEPQKTISLYSDLYIPSKIQKIGARAFKGCKGVEIIEIGARAFTPTGAGYGFGATELGEESFADIEDLKLVVIGQKTTDVHIGKNAFAGNGFTTEVRHYTPVFGGFKNGLWGFTSVENIDEHLPKFNASVSTKGIPEELIERDQNKKNINPKATGVAEMISQ